MTFHVLATLGAVLVLAGWLLRHRLPVHVLCMASSGLLDLGILVGLMVQRSQAIRQELQEPSALLRVHVLASVAALALYPVLATLGVLSVRAKPGLLPWHRRLGRLFLLFKTVNYATSWGV